MQIEPISFINHLVKVGLAWLINLAPAAAVRFIKFSNLFFDWSVQLMHGVVFERLSQNI
jgi:hypothetical protein